MIVELRDRASLSRCYQVTRQYGCRGARIDMVFLRTSVRFWEKAHVNR